MSALSRATVPKDMTNLRDRNQRLAYQTVIGVIYEVFGYTTDLDAYE